MKTLRKRTVLAVDDDEINLMIIVKTAQEAGYQVKSFASSEEALKFIRQSPDAIDIALLDKMMPVVSGLDILKAIKGSKLLKHIPVIMQTGDVGIEQMREGLESGAYYYLTKPFHPDIMKAILHSAEKDCILREDLLNQMEGDQNRFLGLLRDGEFELRTHAEAQLFAAALSRFAPNPELTALGLTELLANAIEHGNLEIGYDRKCQCLWTHTWIQELSARMENPEYSGRTVHVRVVRVEGGYDVTIRDEGAGFDWKPYMNEDERPVKLNEPNGRGIAKAMIMLKNVKYAGRGDEVRCHIETAANPGSTLSQTSRSQPRQKAMKP